MWNFKNCVVDAEITACGEAVKDNDLHRNWQFVKLDAVTEGPMRM